jgi:Ca2+-transporting ATPase
MKGLTSSQISELQKQYGLNELISGNKKSLFSMFINQFNNMLIIILMIAAIISAFHDITEAIVIGVIILLNGAVGFFQEFRTEKTLEALNNMISPTIRVLRDD